MVTGVILARQSKGSVGQPSRLKYGNWYSDMSLKRHQKQLTHHLPLFLLFYFPSLLLWGKEVKNQEGARETLGW